MWLSFFKAAGVPTQLAVRYASIFEDNRIQKSMLPDLSKDLLRDMGIVAVGDIIAVLKHAKQFYVADCGSEVDNASSSIVSANISAVPDVKISRSKDGILTVKRKAEPTGANVATGGSAVKRLKSSSTPQPVKVVKAAVAPDQDVQYTVKLPKGLTPKTQMMLKKRKLREAGISSSASSGSPQTNMLARLTRPVVAGGSDEFLARESPSPLRFGLKNLRIMVHNSNGRMGHQDALPYQGVLKAGVKVPNTNRLKTSKTSGGGFRKAVTFDRLAADNQFESSPEVSSTTDFGGLLEMDRLAAANRKQSARSRLGYNQQQQQLSALLRLGGGQLTSSSSSNHSLKGKHNFKIVASAASSKQRLSPIESDESSWQQSTVFQRLGRSHSYL